MACAQGSDGAELLATGAQTAGEREHDDGDPRVEDTGSTLSSRTGSLDWERTSADIPASFVGPRKDFAFAFQSAHTRHQHKTSGISSFDSPKTNLSFPIAADPCFSKGTRARNLSRGNFDPTEVSTYVN